MVAGGRSVANRDAAVTSQEWDLPTALWDARRAEGLLPEDVPTP